MVLTLSPTTLEGMIHDIERIAKAVDRLSEGQAFANHLRQRLDLVHARAVTIAPRPRVVCLEWLAPLYAAGHWVPEIVELAGGYNVLGSKDLPSRETAWREVETAQPDIVLVMPCGYSLARAMEELARPGQVRDEWRHACDRWPHIYVVDAVSYFSRPGPRLVDGVELLAAILHPHLDHPIDPTRAINLRATPIAMDAAS
jgi:iron complex transport system substrate-binding protein